MLVTIKDFLYSHEKRKKREGVASGIYFSMWLLYKAGC